MLRLLGCSSKAMLWAAALLHTHRGAWGADTVHRASRAFEGMTAAAQELLYPGIAPHNFEDTAGGRRQQQQQQQTKPASTELQELCILAPAVLWHWASLRPCTADEPYGDYMKIVGTACVLGGASLTVIDAQLRQQAADNEELRHQPPAPAPAPQPRFRQQRRQQQRRQQRQPQAPVESPSSQIHRIADAAAPHAALLHELKSYALAVAPKLMAVYERTCWAVWWATHNGNSSSSCGDSSCSSGSLCSGCLSQLGGKFECVATVRHFVWTAVNIYELSCLVQEMAIATAAAQNPALAAARADWQRSFSASQEQHALQVCESLEQWVRLQGSTPALPADMPPAPFTAVNVVSDLLLGGPLLVARKTAPSSKVHARLLSLLCSVLKCCNQAEQWEEVRKEEDILAAAHVAVHMLPDPFDEELCEQLSNAAVRDTAAAADTRRDGRSGRAKSKATNGSAREGHEANDSAEHARGCYPGVTGCAWVALFGHCCLAWVQQLKQDSATDATASSSAYSAEGSSSDAGRRDFECSEAANLMRDYGVNSSREVFLAQPEARRSAFVDLACDVQLWLTAVADVLDQSSPATRGMPATATGAMGMPYWQQEPLRKAAEAVGRQLESTLAVAKSAPMPAQGEAAAAAFFAGFLPRLEALGLALGSIAYGDVCNNPRCSNLCGPAEDELVQGKTSKCSGCKVARFCTAACLKQHWKEHKQLCKALKAASAPVHDV